MFIMSSPKTSREGPWVLIIILINLALLGEPVEALKCYHCTCWVDCVKNKNLFHEQECPPKYNTCLTRMPQSESENYIAKQCFLTNKKETENKNKEKGKIWKYCFTDFCNDQEAGGITNPNPRAEQKQGNSSSSNGGAVVLGKMTGRFVPPAMIMTYVGHWLINWN